MKITCKESETESGYYIQRGVEKHWNLSRSNCFIICCRSEDIRLESEHNIVMSQNSARKTSVIRAFYCKRFKSQQRLNSVYGYLVSHSS